MYKIGLFIPTYNRDYNKVSASIWIRVLQMKKYYEAFGHKVYINNPLGFYDISIFFRLSGITEYYFVKFLKKISKKVFWDTCVNYYEEHNRTNEEQVKYAKLISSFADGIICSTEPIGEKASEFNENVFIMDDPVDRTHFKYMKKNINFENPVFGWSGVSMKSIFLNKYKEILNKKIIIISDKDLKNQRLEFDYKYLEWKYESFPYLLTKSDIAILPREFDDSYNIGHSSFKSLVYAAQSIPIIANKLPSYQKLAKYYNGIVFLEDYDFNITSCIQELRKRNFDNYDVVEYFSCENQALRTFDFLEGVLMQ